MLVMLLGQSRVFYSMSRDGLLPAVGGRGPSPLPHPVDLNHIGGIFVAVFASLIPIEILGELVSIGTLLAFVIVCFGVWILRKRRPDLHRPFKTPMVPLVPILGILVSLGLMASLPLDTWIRLIVWLIIGMVIYFTYGRHHSKVQKLVPDEVKVGWQLDFASPRVCAPFLSGRAFLLRSSPQRARMATVKTLFNLKVLFLALLGLDRHRRGRVPFH